MSNEITRVARAIAERAFISSRHPWPDLSHPDWLDLARAAIDAMAGGDDALRDEITRLRARVAVLEQHLRDAISVADMAMSDANGCACRTEKKWDREAELEVFRAALEAQP